MRRIDYDKIWAIVGPMSPAPIKLFRMGLRFCSLNVLLCLMYFVNSEDFHKFVSEVDQSGRECELNPEFALPKLIKVYQIHQLAHLYILILIRRKAGVSTRHFLHYSVQTDCGRKSSSGVRRVSKFPKLNDIACCRRHDECVLQTWRASGYFPPFLLFCAGFLLPPAASNQKKKLYSLYKLLFSCSAITCDDGLNQLHLTKPINKTFRDN